MIHTLLRAALILITSTFGCSSVLYHPSQDRYFDPAQAHLTYEDTWIISMDGTKLHGWYFKHQTNLPSNGVILFFHGNAENISTHFASLAWILSYGYDYFIFDYRGYGQSEGSPTPQNTVSDGVDVIRQIHQKVPDIPLIIFGQSLGGAIALRCLIELKKEVPIQLIAIDSSFSSYQSVGGSVLSHHWLTWLFQPLAYLLLSDRWAPDGKIAELAPTPLLIIHGDQDRIVDYQLGLELFQQAKEPKEFWKIKGGNHTDVFWRHGTIYQQRFVNLLREGLAKTPYRDRLD